VVAGRLPGGADSLAVAAERGRGERRERYGDAQGKRKQPEQSQVERKAKGLTFGQSGRLLALRGLLHRMASLGIVVAHLPGQVFPWESWRDTIILPWVIVNWRDPIGPLSPPIGAMRGLYVNILATVPFLATWDGIRR